MDNMKKRCQSCDSLIWYFHKRKSRLSRMESQKPYIGGTLTPRRRRAFKIILKDRKILKKTNIRLRTIIGKLNFDLEKVQQKTKILSDASINEIMSSKNLSAPQSVLIQEIIKASKNPNKKNRRYSEDWILLCILLKIRSSSTYVFLREQDILPLPCPRPIRKYLSLVKTKCGFDEQFFKI
eukprot:XP_016657445.1 PREDICTED: uncharacterized protein LOC107882880 [Acyrthosiphon pisum]